MRRLSRKQLSREVRLLRGEYQLMFPFCQVPGCDRIGQDLHEICRGAHRQQAIGAGGCLLVVGRPHHDEMDDYSVWPIARQLAIKKRGDPEGYDRERVNEIRGRAPDAITEGEVEVWTNENKA